MPANAKRRTIRVTYDDGDTTDTAINGTPETIRAYYIGTRFECGPPDGPEKFHTATRVDFTDEGER